MNEEITEILSTITPSTSLTPTLDLHTITNTDSLLRATLLRIKTECVAPSLHELKAGYKTVLNLVPRASKILQTNLNFKAQLHKKISALCARELKRGMSKIGRINIGLRAKKLARELGSSKRTESGEGKKRKDDFERKKREQEMEEQKRQEKKLDYLLNQTELYSHFVLNKKKVGFDDSKRIKMDEKVTNENTKEDPEDIKVWLKEVKEKVVNEDFEDKNKIADSSTNLVVSENTTIIDNAPQALIENKSIADTIKQPINLRTDLKDYQLRGLNWLVNLYDHGINGILADDMGLGKTVQSIAFLGHLAERGMNGPFLIVTPTSTLPNWASEFEKFLPEFTITKYYGTDRKKLKFTTNVVLTSYAVFCLDEKMFLKQKFAYMILDEAQAIKSNKSLRWNKLLKVKARNRLLLTGTPIQNNLKELWALLHFIMPTLFDSLAEFEEWFFKMSDNQLDRLHVVLKPFMLRREKKDVVKELKDKKINIVYLELSKKQRVMYDSLFRSFEDENLLMQYRKVCNHPLLYSKDKVVMGLDYNFSFNIPRILYDEKGIEIGDNEDYNAAKFYYKKDRHSLNGDQKFIFQVYNNIVGCKNNYTSIYNYNTNDNAELIQGSFRYKLENKYDNLMCYQKVISGPPKIITESLEGGIEIDKYHQFKQPLIKLPAETDLLRDSCKLQALDILLDKLYRENHKALVYFQMTKMMNIMEEYLETKNYSYVRLDGNTKINERKELVKKYQNSNIFLFLLSTRAGGLGINLTAADTVIFYDSDWNPTVDKQAMDRAHRLGQKNRVTVYKFVCINTVEERVLEMAVKKDEMQKLVIDKGDFVGANI